MDNSLFLYLSQHRSFWWLLSFYKKIHFYIGSKSFKVKYNLVEEKTNLTSFRQLLKITQNQLFLAVILAVSLQVADPYLSPFFQYMGLKIPDDSDYVTFLATISGIGGVFIGLYYAGISTVGGAIYSQVPNNIRNLLAHERIGSVYMRYLAMLTFLGVCLISLRILGYSRIYLAIPIMSLLAGIGIIAFVKLGQRAFYFFDPTALSHHIFDQLRHWLDMIKAGGYRWDDPAFQNYANKQATNDLETLETLSDISGKEPHLNGRPYAELVQQIIVFLIYYDKFKKQIPSTSLWFEQKYTHRDWYRSDETALSIAHQTGTSLQPETVNNKLWIEDELIPIILHFIKTNIKAKRYRLIQEVLGYMDAYLQSLAENSEVKYAFNILEKLNFCIFSEIGVPAEKISDNEPIEHLGLSEHLATLPITLLLSYSKTFDELSRTEVSKKLSHIRWRNAEDIYIRGFRMYLLPRLEWLKPRLTFELSVENEIISPLWYQTELVLQIEAEQFVENVNCLISTCTNQYQQLIDQMNTAKHPWLSSAIVSRQWEYWNKLQNRLNNFAKVWADISTSRNIEGLAWPDFDMVKGQEQVRNRQQELLRLMSKHSTLLLLFSRPDEFPDYGGQFLHTSGEAVIDALCNNDLKIVGDIFKSYFYGCLLKFDTLRPKQKATDWRAQQEFKIAAAPLLDLIDLSGYARLLADFHGNDNLWAEIKSVWDEYLDKEQASNPINLLAAAIHITEVMFEIPYRSTLRINWKQRVASSLATLPRREVYRSGSMIHDNIVIHKSPLVRIFARERHGSFHDGIDIFIALYLKKRPEKVDIDFGRRRRDLEDTIKYEEKSYSEVAVFQEDDTDEET